MLSVASAPAKAAVRFGVTIGAPVYTYPAYPTYPAPYVAPDSYYAPYYAPAPAYTYPPSIGFGFGWDHRDHERMEHRREEFRERERYEHRDFRGDHRR
jgi:hypothetical protein